MSPRDRSRLEAHLAKFGQTYTGPRRAPTLRDLHQLCWECNNVHVQRRLLPPDQGRFISRGRWVCHRCVSKRKAESATSIGENWLHAWLRSHHVVHEMNAVVDGMKFDCLIPDWNVLIEVDSDLGHHTASHRKQDWRRDQLAQREGYFLQRVRWNDRDLCFKVNVAREQGLALRQQRQRQGGMTSDNPANASQLRRARLNGPALSRRQIPPEQRESAA